MIESLLATVHAALAAIEQHHRERDTMDSLRLLVETREWVGKVEVEAERCK